MCSNHKAIYERFIYKVELMVRFEVLSRRSMKMLATIGDKEDPVRVLLVWKLFPLKEEIC